MLMRLYGLHRSIPPSERREKTRSGYVIPPNKQEEKRTGEKRMAGRRRGEGGVSLHIIACAHTSAWIQCMVYAVAFSGELV